MDSCHSHHIVPSYIRYKLVEKCLTLLHRVKGEKRMSLAHCRISVKCCPNEIDATKVVQEGCENVQCQVLNTVRVILLELGQLFAKQRNWVFVLAFFVCWPKYLQKLEHVYRDD